MPSPAAREGKWDKPVGFRLKKRLEMVWMEECLLMNEPTNRLASLKNRIHYTFPFYILVIFTTSLKIINREKVFLVLFHGLQAGLNQLGSIHWEIKTYHSSSMQSSLCPLDTALTTGNCPSVCLQLHKVLSVYWGREMGEMISWSRLSELWLQHTEISPRKGEDTWAPFPAQSSVHIIGEKRWTSMLGH